MMGKNVLTVTDLRTYLYTSRGVVKAVDGINLRVDKNEIVGIVGESGCGKTMTALSIMRMVPNPPAKIVEGNIVLGGKNLLELTEEEMRSLRGCEVSMVFQDPMTYLNPVMRIGDQLAEGIKYHQGGKEKEVKEKVLQALEKVRITEPSVVYRYYPHQLSCGMRQRVLIAMALSGNPILIIADEPTSALDTTVQAQVLGMIEDIVKGFNMTMLLITHDLGIVAEICDRVYVMYAGKIMESADVFALYEEPMHPYTKGLLKSVLSIDEFKEKLETIRGAVPDLTNLPRGCRFHPRCPQVMDVCREKESSTIEMGSKHGVSCWLYS